MKTSSKMKSIVIISTFLLLTPLRSAANNFNAILKSIEKNSTHLASANRHAEATKAEAHSQNTLESPEVGANYLFGNNNIGNRLDLNLSQSFELPSVYAQRKKLIRQQMENADLSYLNSRQNYLLKAKQLCIEVVYCNALANHLEDDITAAQSLAQAIEQQYQKGDVTALEHHKAQQSMTIFLAEKKQVLTHKKNLLAILRQMNGNNPVTIEDIAYTHSPLPKDFQAWLNGRVEQSPLYKQVKGEVNEKEELVKLNRRELLPKFNIGYMSEMEKNDQYHGITFGMQIPIWNRNRKVKAAQKQKEAAELELTDTQQSITTQWQGLYNEALELQNTMISFRESFKKNNISTLLRKALDARQINMVTYQQEIQWNHELYEKQLQVECDLELKIAELTATEL